MPIRRMLVVLGLVGACSGGGQVKNATCLPVDEGATCWEQLLPMGSGGFPADPGSNDSPKWEPGRVPLGLQPILGPRGELWMLSRTHAWSSGDGLTWNHVEKTDTGGRIWSDVVFFDGRLWMFGGWSVDDRVLLNDVWSSTDGATWTQVGQAEWSPRARHRVVAFGGKLWLFGGADRVSRDFVSESVRNDVWSSDDGVRWTQRAEAAAFAPVEEAKIVELGGGLLMVGSQGRADVWRSADGVAWTQLSAGAAFGARNDYAAVVFAGKAWVYGGWRERSTNALNDIWYSTDGAAWTRQTESAPWGPRSPRTIVFQERIWIYSGKHTGAPDNWGGDVWTMSAR